MADLKRGEIWWAELPKPVGRRPVLLLSRDRAYQVRSSVTVAVLTRTIRNIPVEVKLGPAQGVPVESVVNLDEIVTVPKSVLATRLCALDDNVMHEVDKAIHFALDLRQ
jgi:mRNA interferase MazF